MRRFLDVLCRCCRRCLAGCRVNTLYSIEQREKLGRLLTAKLHLFEAAKALSSLRNGAFKPVGGGEL